MVEFCTLCKLDKEMHVCTSQLVLPIVFIVHLFNIVFFFYYPYGLLSEIKYYYYYCGSCLHFKYFFYCGAMPSQSLTLLMRREKQISYN